MRSLLALSLLVSFATAAEMVTFSLPGPDGQTHRLEDFSSRYVLLVYQGIP